MADIILNRNTHPDWNGEKTKMLYEFPKNMKLWDEYAEIRAEALRTDGNFQAATDFYLAHREEMDEGAVVSWDARYNHDEVSALQHAMNLKLQDEAAFQAEYQNAPLPEDLSDDTLLSVDEICGKVNGIARYRVPWTGWMKRIFTAVGIVKIRLSKEFWKMKRLPKLSKGLMKQRFMKSSGISSM